MSLKRWHVFRPFLSESRTSDRHTGAVEPAEDISRVQLEGLLILGRTKSPVTRGAACPHS